MTSSLRMARKRAIAWKFGCTRHLAVAIMEAVKGPLTPFVDKNSDMFGVSLNGIGLSASKSPVT